MEKLFVFSRHCSIKEIVMPFKKSAFRKQGLLQDLKFPLTGK